MMVHAKNYETVSTLVKVMQKKPWPLFFPDTVKNGSDHQHNVAHVHSHKICIFEPLRDMLNWFFVQLVTQLIQFTHP